MSDLPIPQNLSSPDGPDIDFLPDFIKSTHDNLLQDGFLVPVFVFFDNENKVTNVALIPSEIMNNKALLGSTLKKLIEEKKPAYYWLATEAWATSSEKLADDNETLNKVCEDGQVSSLPREKRDEIVVINLTDNRNNNNEKWFGTYKLIRDRQGVIHNFTPTQWIKQEGQFKLTGRLVV